MRQITNILAYIEQKPEITALNRAVAIAKSADAKLTLATVIRPAKSQVLFTRASFDLEKIEWLLVQERKRQLHDAIDGFEDAGIEIAVRVYLGDPVETIVDAVRSEGFDFLIKTLSTSKGLREQMFGSIDLRLMRACPCPVAIIRPKPEGYSGRAVVAVDFDEDDELKSSLNQEILDSVALLLKPKGFVTPKSSD